MLKLLLINSQGDQVVTNVFEKASADRSTRHDTPTGKVSASSGNQQASITKQKKIE
ncbi:hypothetical protein [Heyndrickxia acidicola]|uniref:Uncharacterized protein n=1 Tax=Heyndrickxia acidicola TaxID=209389 RepID=A0ABU6MIJ2_9BACI|nr:hypothetical protein [Heyndrickxia acidicola]MED1204335.1 hypothetical protein [Heyndrickxia acidicola]